MKITEVSVTLFSWSASASTRLPGAPGEHPREGDLGYLRIETDEGVTGEAFLGGLDSPGSLDAPRLIRWLKPIVLGRDPLDREALHGRMMAQARFCGHRAVGSMDVALWDLAGKACGQPIHRLLGTARTEVPAYVSSQRFPDAAGYVEQAAATKAQGWRGYKIHPPKQPDTDIAILHAVRRECGPGYALMLDGGWQYDYPSALRIGRELESAGYVWFEDPFGHDDVYQSAKLRRQLHIPILATEQPPAGLTSYPAWLMAEATDMLRGDVPTKGGITTMIKTAHLAEAFGMSYEIHYSGNALCDLAGVHVAMAIRNCMFLESLVPDPIHHVGAQSGVAVSDGVVAAPTGPGLGVEVDTEYITHHRLAVAA